MSIKLGKLPDRTPVRLTINVSPALHARLAAYAAIYAEAYGQEEPIVELIPAILSSFLDADRAFAKARRQRPREEGQRP
jgi:hypothetical protein